MIKGIDISKYQNPNTNLKESGLGYAFIKATEGLHTDPKLAIHTKNIDNSHLLKGYYHFFRDSISPITQAQAFYNAIKNYLDEYTLPPVLDIEDPLAVNDGKLQIRVQSFLTEVEKLTGIKPIIYINKNFAIQYKLSFPSYLLWDACYEKNPACPYSGWLTWTFWQYTSKSKVEGESDLLDADLFNGNANQLIALTKSATFKNNESPEIWVQNNKVIIY